MAERQISLVKTAFMRMWSLSNVPCFWLKPSVVELNSERAELSIPLTRRSRNHYKSMYLSALVTGADLAVGVLAMEMMSELQSKQSLIFKDLEAKFFRRAEADVHFLCEEGRAIEDLILRAMDSGEREERKIYVRAICPSLSQETVAQFALTLSVRNKRR